MILELPEGSFSRGDQNKGGVNILDIPTKNYQDLLDAYGETRGKEMFWDQYNQPFLEDSFKNGDNVRLLSDPTSSTNRTGFYNTELNEIEGPNGLAKKYEYIYDPTTNTYIKN